MSTNPENESQSASSSSQDAPKPPFEPIRLPTVEEIRGQDIWNNCAVRSVVSGVMGGGLGLFMGMFLGALENPIMQDEMTGRQQFIYTAKQMGRKSWSSCKAFAVMGFVFSAAECAIEKARAKHDTTNTVVAGCVTGGTISARGGPKAACAGCAGFAAFSVLIENPDKDTPLKGPMNLKKLKMLHMEGPLGAIDLFRKNPLMDDLYLGCGGGSRHEKKSQAFGLS
ncbi:mitochondrial import inner membrane translocase subunit TIM22-4 [Forsythia ovata]|uniref:Mitochondrial import inner membrane translocase subunit TIM22-4 n=1 Tax=Forsythia ovata TaxID=205694 RepID=A0ABD1T910_9LAMI